MKNLIMVSMIVLSVISGLYLPVKADIDNSANGQWQYVINRGDTKGGGGSMANPSCPFYIGYFRLDYKKAKKYKNGYFMDSSKYKLLNSSSGAYVITDKTYEVKGSYTSENRNDLCSNPLTKAQKERAPIMITKISPDGRKLEWFSDFQVGTNRGNAIWYSEANYDSSNNSMKGTLKAYICSGKASGRNCNLINTAKFTARKVKSIQEASGKPLFSKEASLSTWMRWIIEPFSPRQAKVDISPLQNYGSEQISKQYVKPSLGAILMVKAADDLIAQKCADGGCACDYTSNGAKFCVKCKYVNCPGKEGATVPPSEITKEQLWDRSTPSYCGNCAGNGPCNSDGTGCL
jgi:hypothetical protein